MNLVKRDYCTEGYYTSYTWYFLIIMFLYALVKDGLAAPSIANVLKDIFFIGVFAAVNLIRSYMNKSGIHELDYFYLRSRLVEIILAGFAFFYIGFSAWIAGYILGLVVLVTVLKDRKAGFHTILMSVITAVVLYGLSNGSSSREHHEYATFFVMLLAGIPLWYIVARLSEDWQEEINSKEQELSGAVRQREESVVIVKELEDRNEKIKEKLKKLEEQNEELREVLNKYYDFHHISSVVGSIFDINGLLKFINETIIEIVEVDYSTIFLFEPRRGSLEIQITNIANEDNLQRLLKNINNDIIFDIIENGSPFVVNLLESMDDYEFVRERDVKSFVCMPISTIKKKYGIVLIESREYNKFTDENQKLISLIGHQLSTSIENLELYKKMKELATTDGLTGIYNRLYFQERLSKELKIAHENDYPLSLVIFDIDHFKKVNDTYSHLIGDKVLKTVTSVVKNSIRRSDMIARYGGEEFIILFPNMDIDRAEELCESLRKKIHDTQIPTRDENINVTASFGIANYPANAYSEENLVRAADRALYEAKNSGRNQVRLSKEKLQ